MKMQTENAPIVRPGSMKLDAGATDSGGVALHVEHEGKIIRVLLSDEEAERYGVGIVQAAGVARFVRERAKQIVTPVASNVLNLGSRRQ